MPTRFVSAALLIAALVGGSTLAARSQAPGGPATQVVAADCTVRMQRKYDYSGRLYIRKVRICRKA